MCVRLETQSISIKNGNLSKKIENFDFKYPAFGVNNVHRGNISPIRNCWAILRGTRPRSSHNFEVFSFFVFSLLQYLSKSVCLNATRVACYESLILRPWFTIFYDEKKSIIFAINSLFFQCYPQGRSKFLLFFQLLFQIFFRLFSAFLLWISLQLTGDLSLCQSEKSVS